MKYSFYADYSEGAHPEILKYLVENNDAQDLTYGYDSFCALAADRIRDTFGLPNADVQFLPAGTITNVVGLSSMLKPFQSVVSPITGHINVHETGALEATGHKINYFETSDGKITTDIIQAALDVYEDEHTVVPKAVYMTQSTEVATLYSKSEFEKIVQFAKEKDLYTFVDGARLPMAFASSLNDMTPKEFGALGLDMFYIGGTKNGGLFGEALVIVNEDLQKDIRFYMKRQGAVSGKARSIGSQFARFFDKDELWLQCAKHACEAAHSLYEGMAALGAEFEQESSVNQVFPILEISVIEKLEKDYGFYRYEKVGETKQKIRLVTSWATPQSVVDEFLKVLASIIA